MVETGPAFRTVRCSAGHTDMAKSDWEGQDISGQTHAGVKFTDLDCTEVVNRGALFTDCTFQRVTFNCSVHTDAAFVNCTFTGCSFFDTRFTECKFVGSNLCAAPSI